MQKHELLNLRGLVGKPTIFLFIISYVFLATLYFSPNFVFSSFDFQVTIHQPIQDVLNRAADELRSFCGYVLTY